MAGKLSDFADTKLKSLYGSGKEVPSHVVAACAELERLYERLSLGTVTTDALVGLVMAIRVRDGEFKVDPIQRVTRVLPARPAIDKSEDI